jgi:hypothetical protein
MKWNTPEAQARAQETRKLTPVERALAKPKSKTLAIKATCWQCQGGDADPCWQWRVGNCEIPSCPLYAHRPHQRHLGAPTPASLLVSSDTAS